MMNCKMSSLIKLYLSLLFSGEQCANQLGCAFVFWVISPWLMPRNDTSQAMVRLRARLSSPHSSSREFCGYILKYILQRLMWFTIVSHLSCMS